MSLSVSHSLKQAFDDASSSLLDPEDSLLPRAFLVRVEGKELVLSETRTPSDAAKSEWSQVLEELLTSASSTPGYVLYRLDSRSSAGQYEWLLITFRPDGAPIKQRMQYGPSQEALTRALGEWSFLDTIHASTPKDCIFPTKLRSDRKHDYQNPQVRDKSKSAAEQAGASVGGARRYFQPATAKPKGASSDDVPTPKVADTVVEQSVTPPTPLPPLPASAPAPPTPIPNEEPPLLGSVQASDVPVQEGPRQMALAESSREANRAEATPAQDLTDAVSLPQTSATVSPELPVLAPPLPVDAPVPPTPDPKEPAPTADELSAVGPVTAARPAEAAVPSAAEAASAPAHIEAERSQLEEPVEEVPSSAVAPSTVLSDASAAQSDGVAQQASTALGDEDQDSAPGAADAGLTLALSDPSEVLQAQGSVDGVVASHPISAAPPRGTNSESRTRLANAAARRWQAAGAGQRF